MHCNLGSFEFLFIFFGMRVSLIGFRYNLGVIVESKSTLITMQNSTLLVASFLFGWKFQKFYFPSFSFTILGCGFQCLWNSEEKHKCR